MVRNFHPKIASKGVNDFMNGLLWINLIAFLLVTAYAISLFVYVVKTRIEYIKLGKKSEFDDDIKDRWRRILVHVFGQKRLLKDKKSGAIHVMFFYGFLLVQFGAIDFIWKGIKPGSHLPLGPLYPGFTFFQELVTLTILVAVVWAFYRRYVEKLVRLKRGFKNGLVLLFIGGLMLSVLLGNGMSMIWHGHEGTWTEPVASLIAAPFSGIPEAAGHHDFLYRMVDSLAVPACVPCVRTAIQACSLDCRTSQCLFDKG